MKVAAALVLAIALALVSVPAVRHLRERPPSPPPAVRLSLPMPPGVEPGWGDAPLDAAIAPDESAIAFVATRGGVRQLWLRVLSEPEAMPLAGTEGAQLPAWKQTGTTLSFFADGRLKVIAVGNRRTSDLADAPNPQGAAWLADGSIIFAGTGSGPLRRMREGAINDASRLAEGDQAHVHPVAIAGTNEFVYVAVRQDGRHMSRLSSGTTARDLTTTAGHAALVGDRLLHVRDTTLLAYERNPQTGALAPRGSVLALDVGVSQGRALFAASPRLLLHAPSAKRAYELVWLDETGTRSGAVADTGDYWQVRLSPDDERAAVTTTDALLGALDIVILPARPPGDPARLTRALAADTDPVWSPDGTRVLFRSLGGGRPDMVVRSTRGGDGPDEPVLRSTLDEIPSSWDGERILFHAVEGSDTDVFELSPRSGRYAAILDTPFNERDARVSPDGRWIAFVSDESGRADVYVMPPGGGRLRLSFDGGTRPRWMPGGRAIVFLRGSQVMRADRIGDRFAAARVLFEADGIRDFDVAHRSGRLLAILPAGTAPPPAIAAVLDWMTVGGRR